MKDEIFILIILWCVTSITCIFCVTFSEPFTSVIISNIFWIVTFTVYTYINKEI